MKSYWISKFENLRSTMGHFERASRFLAAKVYVALTRSSAVFAGKETAVPRVGSGKPCILERAR